MPKQARSSIAKVRQTCQEYPDEFSATPAGDLQCNLSDVLVKCDKKFFVESHRTELESRPKSSRSRPRRDFDTTRPRRDRDLEQKVETRPRLERVETETRHETFKIRGSQKIVNILTVNI